MNLVLVFVGAGLGGVLRHGVNVGAGRIAGAGFPWGTLAVNVAGGLAMGLLAGWLALRADWAAGQQVRLFLATGLLGGFTTFSAFSLDAVLLWQRGALAEAAGYVAASVVLSIAGLALGLLIARGLA